MYFSGQGKVFIAARDVNGKPGNLRWLGNVPALSVALTVTKLEHKESYSGQRLTDLVLVTEKKAALNMTLEDYDPSNLALVLQSSVVTQATAAVTGEILPTVDSDDFDNASALQPIRLMTAKQGIGTVVLKDSTVSPKTLVQGTNYRVLSAAGGMIEIYDTNTGGPFVQPLKVDYTPTAVTAFGLFTQPAPEFWLHFEGINTADGNKNVIVDLFKVQTDPAAELGLIQDAIGQFTLTGAVLVDDERDANGPLGQFGQIIYAAS